MRFIADTQQYVIGKEAISEGIQCKSDETYPAYA